MTDTMTLTYQTRVRLDEKSSSILDAYGELHNQVEHSLYAMQAKGVKLAACKNDFLKRFGITARQFNGCRVSIEGKIASAKSGQERAVLHYNKESILWRSRLKDSRRGPLKAYSKNSDARTIF